MSWHRPASCRCPALSQSGRRAIIRPLPAGPQAVCSVILGQMHAVLLVGCGAGKSSLLPRNPKDPRPYRPVQSSDHACALDDQEGTTRAPGLRLQGTPSSRLGVDQGDEVRWLSSYQLLTACAGRLSERCRPQRQDSRQEFGVGHRSMELSRASTPFGSPALPPGPIRSDGLTEFRRSGR